MWGVHSLKKHGKAEEDTAKEDSHAGGSAGDVGRGSSASGATSASGSSGATKASDGNRRGCSRSGSRSCGGGHGARCGVALVRRLSTAGVVSTAAVGAGVVTVAVGDTLVAPLLADVEGEGLRVFGDVRGDAVLTNARVSQIILRFVSPGSSGFWYC
jgi:hypothetical protein